MHEFAGRQRSLARAVIAGESGPEMRARQRRSSTSSRPSGTRAISRRPSHTAIASAGSAMRSLGSVTTRQSSPIQPTARSSALAAAGDSFTAVNAAPHAIAAPWRRPR